MSAIIKFLGAETGGVEEVSSAGSQLSVVTTPTPVQGTYAYKFTKAASSQAALHMDIVAAGTAPTNDFIVGFYFRYTGTPAASAKNSICLWSNAINGTRSGSLGVSTDGSSNLFLEVVAADSADSTVGSTALSADTWYWIEVVFHAHDTTGSVEVFLSGTSEAAVTDVDTLVGNDRDSLDFRSFASSGGVDVDWFLDNIYLMDAATDASDRLGPVEIFLHTMDLDSATPSINGVNSGSADVLDAGTFLDTATLTETNTADYTGGTQGGGDGVALDSGITEQPTALKSISWLRRGSGSGTTHYGNWGNDTDGSSSFEFDLGTSFHVWTEITQSASILPALTEAVNLGFEKSSGGRELYVAWQVAAILHVPSAGPVTHTATSSMSAAAATAAGTADRVSSGTGTPQGQAATVVGAASLVSNTFTGTSTPQGQAATVVGTADKIFEVSSGTGTPQGQAATVVGAADRTSVGSGTPQGQAATVAGAGTHIAVGSFTGTGTPQGQAATVVGTGTHIAVGASNMQGAQAGVAASAYITHIGSAAFQSGNAFWFQPVRASSSAEKADSNTVTADAHQETGNLATHLSTVHTCTSSMQAAAASIVSSGARTSVGTSVLQAVSAAITGAADLAFTVRTATSSLPAKAATLTASGYATRVASSALTAVQAAASAASVVERPASGTLNSASATVTGAGTHVVAGVYTATSALQASPATVSAAGALAFTVYPATSSLQAAVASIVGAGDRVSVASSALQAVQAQITGAGTQSATIYTATSSLQAAVASIVGAGDRITVAASALQAVQAQITGAGTHAVTVHTATSALQAAQAQVAGAGDQLTTATSNLQATQAQIVGVGTQSATVRTATSSLQAAQAQVAGAGTQTAVVHVATSSLQSDPAQVAGGGTHIPAGVYTAASALAAAQAGAVASADHVAVSTGILQAQPGAIVAAGSLEATVHVATSTMQAAQAQVAGTGAPAGIHLATSALIAAPAVITASGPRIAVSSGVLQAQPGTVVAAGSLEATVHTATSSVSARPASVSLPGDPRVNDPSFDDSNAWSPSAPVSGGQLVVNTDGGGLYVNTTPIPAVIGRKYIWEIDVASFAEGEMRVDFGGNRLADVENLPTGVSRGTTVATSTGNVTLGMTVLLQTELTLNRVSIWEAEPATRTSAATGSLQADQAQAAGNAALVPANTYSASSALVAVPAGIVAAGYRTAVSNGILQAQPGTVVASGSLEATVHVASSIMQAVQAQVAGAGLEATDIATSVLDAAPAQVSAAADRVFISNSVMYGQPVTIVADATHISVTHVATASLQAQQASILSSTLEKWPQYITDPSITSIGGVRGVQSSGIERSADKTGAGYDADAQSSGVRRSISSVGVKYGANS